MWGFFNKIASDKILQVGKPKAPHFVRRDALKKKKATPDKLKKSSALGVSKSLSRDCEAISEPLLQIEDGTKDFERRWCGSTVEEKGAIRVKIMMTKQEAARLLSKCKDGGRLEFNDVARELVQIPLNRVDVVAPRSCRNTVLEGYP